MLPAGEQPRPSHGTLPRTVMTRVVEDIDESVIHRHLGGRRSPEDGRDYGLPDHRPYIQHSAGSRVGASVLPGVAIECRRRTFGTRVERPTEVAGQVPGVGSFASSSSAGCAAGIHRNRCEASSSPAVRRDGVPGLMGLCVGKVLEWPLRCLSSIGSRATGLVGKSCP